MSCLRSLVRSRLVVAAHTPVGVRSGLASAHLRHSVTTGQSAQACLAWAVAFSRARGSSLVLTSSMANRAGLVRQARGWSETGKGIRGSAGTSVAVPVREPGMRSLLGGARQGVVWAVRSGVVVAAAASGLGVGGEPAEAGLGGMGCDPRFAQLL